MLGRLTGWQRLTLVVAVPLTALVGFMVVPEVARGFPSKRVAQAKHLRFIASTVTNLMGRHRIGALREDESIRGVEIPPGEGYYDNSGLGQVEFDVRLKHPGMSDEQLIAMLRTKYSGKVADFDSIDAMWQHEEDAVPSRQVAYIAQILGVLAAGVAAFWLFCRMVRWVARGFATQAEE